MEKQNFDEDDIDLNEFQDCQDEIKQFESLPEVEFKNDEFVPKINQQQLIKMKYETEDIKKLNILRERQDELSKQDINFMHEMHGQSKYIRENFQNPASADLLIIKEGCEQEGEYSKWTRQRMNDFQQKIFIHLRDQLDNVEGLRHISDNQVLRFLNIADWDHECSLKRLKECDALRSSLNCYYMNEIEFTFMQNLNIVVNKGYVDKVGRPIVHLLLRNLILKGVSPNDLKRFFCYTLDQVCKNMACHVDQLILLVDCYSFGYSNWYVQHTRELLSFIQKCFAGRQYCTCLIRQNIILKAIQKIAKQFIDQGTQKKFRLLGGDFQIQLKKFISPENLPLEYGGTQPSLD